MPLVKKHGDYAKAVGDRNDCVVRALSIAANKPYEECSALYVSHGRKRGRRTDRSVSIAVHRALKSVVVFHIRPYPTLTKFIKARPTGRFVLIRNGHAFALIDGVVHDWVRGTGARSRIQMSFEVVKVG